MAVDTLRGNSSAADDASKDSEETISLATRSQVPMASTTTCSKIGSIAQRSGEFRLCPQDPSNSRMIGHAIFSNLVLNNQTNQTGTREANYQPSGSQLRPPESGMGYVLDRTINPTGDPSPGLVADSDSVDENEPEISELQDSDQNSDSTDSASSDNNNVLPLATPSTTEEEYHEPVNIKESYAGDLPLNSTGLTKSRTYFFFENMPCLLWFLRGQYQCTESHNEPTAWKKHVEEHLEGVDLLSTLKHVDGDFRCLYNKTTPAKPCGFNLRRFGWEIFLDHVSFHAGEPEPSDPTTISLPGQLGTQAVGLSPQSPELPPNTRLLQLCVERDLFDERGAEIPLMEKAQELEAEIEDRASDSDSTRAVGPRSVLIENPPQSIQF